MTNEAANKATAMEKLNTTENVVKFLTLNECNEIGLKPVKVTKYDLNFASYCTTNKIGVDNNVILIFKGYGKRLKRDKVQRAFEYTDENLEKKIAKVGEFNPFQKEGENLVSFESPTNGAIITVLFTEEFVGLEIGTECNFISVESRSIKNPVTLKLKKVIGA